MKGPHGRPHGVSAPRLRAEGLEGSVGRGGRGAPRGRGRSRWDAVSRTLGAEVRAGRPEGGCVVSEGQSQTAQVRRPGALPGRAGVAGSREAGRPLSRSDARAPKPGRPPRGMQPRTACSPRTDMKLYLRGAKCQKLVGTRQTRYSSGAAGRTDTLCILKVCGLSPQVTPAARSLRP